MAIKFLKRGFFQRICGIPATAKAQNDDGWTYADGQVTIELDKIPELRLSGGAVRLEGADLPERLLVTHGEDGEYYAYRNRCTHLGHRRLDPVPGTDTVQCCSVNKSTYNLNGERIYGPAKHAITTYPVTQEENRLVISLR